MPDLILPAPAKINRFLHIVGQRPDGYHLLQTLFQFIDLNDVLEFTLHHSREVRLNSTIPGISAANNLVLRAAQALQAASSTGQGVDISLKKQIPIGAGLGGGSSDAATTLLALNQLWDLRLSTETLMSIGVKLGADVPIFIRGQSAWAEGIGEEFTDITLPEGWIVLVLPDAQINTAEIFFDKALSRNTAPCRMCASLIETGHNDCEPVVRQRYPQVAEALDWLNDFAPARLTGTGACIFAPVESQAAGAKIVEQLPKTCKAWVLRTLNRSPALDRLGS